MPWFITTFSVSTDREVWDYIKVQNPEISWPLLDISVPGNARLVLLHQVTMIVLSPFNVGVFSRMIRLFSMLGLGSFVLYSWHELRTVLWPLPSSCITNVHERHNMLQPCFQGSPLQTFRKKLGERAWIWRDNVAGFSPPSWLSEFLSV